MYTLSGAPLAFKSVPQNEVGADVKFAQYSHPNPASVGITLNTEGLAFREAVKQGFVPMTVDGLKLFLSWLNPSSSELLNAGLWDWFAFRTRFVSLLPPSSLPMVASNLQAQYPEAVKALEAQYAIAITPLPAPPSANQPAPTPAVVTYQPALQVVIDKRVPPSPGDGINFATVAWRSIEQGSDQSWRAVGPWVRWVGSFVNRGTNDPRVVILDVSDVDYEAHNFQGVPGRIAPMWDWSSLQAAINGSGSGSPPPSLPSGVITAIVRPAIPSGSLPIPDEPSVNEWTDVMAPPPPSPIAPLPPALVPDSGGGLVTTAPSQTVVSQGTNRPIMFSDADSSATAAAPPLSSSRSGLLGLGLGLGALYLFSRRRRQGA